ncbi:hypothetical protein HWV62_28148 [Athelia sp. TMB]|nr:hypothetical protein HWV62_28148 [Athelia sp. TMB]
MEWSLPTLSYALPKLFMSSTPLDNGLSSRINTVELLKAAFKLHPGGLSTLKGAAACALWIVESVKRFKSNRGEWEAFGWFVRNTMAGVILLLSGSGVSNPPGKRDAQDGLEDLLEALENVEAKIHGLQRTTRQALSPSHIVSFNRDRREIEAMQRHIELALTHFGCLPSIWRGINVDPTKILARVVERYTNMPIQVDQIIGMSSSESYERIHSASEYNNDRLLVPAMIFNANNTSGGTVMNVAGNFTTYGVDGDHIAIKITLDKLPYAEGVSWDPDLVCLLGTRQSILGVIQAWSLSADSRNIFWLEGVVGSGKTAVAHTVAQLLHQKGTLVSSFFFNRNIASRNTAQMLFTTISRDIANCHPAIAEDISKVLDGEHALASAPLSRQFEALIAGPLSRHPIDKPFVIVIDALDESTPTGADAALLDILRSKMASLPSRFRIFVTSRPTSSIKQSLSRKPHVHWCPLDINSPENRVDIAAYVDTQLRESIISSKMGPAGLDEVLVRNLKLMAEGLFIWIATIFGYLRSAYSPKEKLIALLSNSSPQGLMDADKKMDVLYAAILNDCGSWDEEEFRRDYGLVMGAIMAAKRSLSLATLRTMCDDIQGTSLKELLERFGSVLLGFHDENQPIRILHLSFREFITHRAASTPENSKFLISEKEHSQRLAVLCLKTVARELAVTPILYGLGYLAKDDDDPPGIPIVHGFSEQLLYSFESLTDHLVDVDESSASNKALPHIRHFLMHDLVHWLEIVASKCTFRGSLVIRRWMEVHAPTLRELYEDKKQAPVLCSLAKRLAYVGRFEEGLHATQEAVDLYRSLAAESGDPSLFHPALAWTLNDKSVRLSQLARRDEALASCQEALELYRALAATHPTTFNSGLAACLNNASNYLLGNDRPEECLSMCEEAVSLLRALAAEKPQLLNANLAASLASLSNRLSAVGRPEESLAAIEEATTLYRDLVAQEPTKYNPDLAMALNTLSSRLSGLSFHQDALKAIQESVQLCRALAAKRPLVYSAQLAASLHSLSARFVRLSKHDEALVAVQAAVNLRRDLVEDRPAAFNEFLAQSLHSLASILSGLGLREEALSAIQEAVDLYLNLAATRPKEFDLRLRLARNQLRSARLSTGYLNGHYKQGPLDLPPSNDMAFLFGDSAPARVPVPPPPPPPFRHHPFHAPQLPAPPPFIYNNPSLSAPTIPNPFPPIHPSYAPQLPAPPGFLYNNPSLPAPAVPTAFHQNHPFYASPLPAPPLFPFNPSLTVPQLSSLFRPNNPSSYAPPIIHNRPFNPQRTDVLYFEPSPSSSSSGNNSHEMVIPPEPDRARGSEQRRGDAAREETMMPFRL